MRFLNGLIMLVAVSAFVPTPKMVTKPSKISMGLGLEDHITSISSKVPTLLMALEEAKPDE